MDTAIVAAASPVASQKLGWRRVAGLLLVTTFVGPLIGGMLFAIAILWLVWAFSVGNHTSSSDNPLTFLSMFAVLTMWSVALGAIPGLIVGLISLARRPSTAGEVMLLTALVAGMPCVALLPFLGIGAVVFVCAVAAAGITFVLAKRLGFSLLQ